MVKDFDEDDNHRIADSIGTAFYEGEGDVYLEINGDKLIHFNKGLNWMELNLKNLFPIFFISIILLVLVQLVEAFHRCWVLILIL